MLKGVSKFCEIRFWNTLWNLGGSIADDLSFKRITLRVSALRNTNSVPNCDESWLHKMELHPDY